MSVRVTLPRPRLRDFEFSSTRLMRSVGTAMVGRIRSRTARGVDVDGTAFRPLTPGYRKQKQRAIGSGAADLTVSGTMLNGMRVKPSPTHVDITFAGGGAGGATGGTFIQRSRSLGAAQKAFFHNEAGAGKSKVIREFFGLSDEDEEFILDRVDAFIARQL